MVVVHKRTSRLMKGCVCASNVLLTKTVPLFALPCFLKLANLYEEDL